MRRISKILSMALAVVVLGTTAFGYAASLKVEDTSIKDGATKIQMENLGVKITFNKSVHFKDNAKVNSKYCKLYDDKGKELPTIILTDEKDPNVLLLLLKTAFTEEELKEYGLEKDSKNRGSVLKKLTDYSFVVGKGFQSADGSKLDKDFKITFTTMDPGESTKYSMGMMLLMVGVMVVATAKTAKNKKEEDSTKEKTKEEKVNPYKKARETGKSVEEIVAKEEKKKAKAAKKAEAAEKRRAAKEARLAEEEAEADDIHRVKAPAPISKAGGKYKSGLAKKGNKKAQKK